MNLIHMTVTAGLMILLSLFIRHFFLTKVPKVTFVVLWLLVIIRLLVPFEIPFGMRLPEIFNNLSTTQPELSLLLFDGTVSLSTKSFYLAEQNVGVYPIHSEILNFFSESMMLGMWTVGMITMVLYFMVNHVKFLHYVSDSIPVENKYLLELTNKYQSKLKRQIQIRQSQKIVSPLTYGVISPIILIPKTFNFSQPGQLEYVFAHEYIHIKRFDCLIKIIATIVLCIHWFNPLVWLMYVVLQRDIELACDEKVLGLFPEQAKLTYALTLIDLAKKQNKTIPVYSYFSKYSGIEERIKMMAGKNKKSWFGATLAVLLVSGTMVVLASEPEEYLNSETPVEEIVEHENYSPKVEIPDIEINDDLATDEDNDVEVAVDYFIEIDEQTILLINEDGREYKIYMQ